MVQLGAESFTPIAYTTESIIVLVCNSKFGDGFTENDNSITIAGDPLGAVPAAAAHVAGGPDLSVIDRFYLIKSVTDNTLTQISFNYAKPSAPKPEAAPAPAGGGAAGGGGVAPPGGGAAPKADPGATTTSTTDVVATAFIERHRMSHYSLGGGVVAIRSSPTVFSAITTPTMITAQTCTADLTTVTQNTTGAANAPTYLGSYNPCSTTPLSPLPATTTSFESNIATTTSTGTANYAQGVKGGDWQVDALAGVTVYPFGRDTYTINQHRGFAVPFGFKRPLDSIGVFLGTSINTFGNFTAAPAYEFYPGMQLLVGVTWWNKTTLQSGITACSSYGTSPSYAVMPPASSYNVTTTYTAATGTAVSNTTVTEAKSSMTTNATSGCSNGNVATILSGTTVPTNSAYKPAFSIGVIFNTNLMKAFTGIFK